MGIASSLAIDLRHSSCSAEGEEPLGARDQTADMHTSPPTQRRPDDIFVDHRACGLMGGDVVDKAVSHHPHTTSVAEKLAVVGTCSHHAYSLSPVV